VSAAGEARFDAKAFALLSEMREEDARALAELVEFKKLARGRKLFREGGEAEGLVLLASGRLELTSKRGEKAEIGPGSALGGLSLVVIGPRETTARTLEPCGLWTLQREDFLRLADDHPRTACRLCEAILQEVGSALREQLGAAAR